MSSRKMEPPHHPFVSFASIICFVAALFLGAADVRAQEGSQPNRGFHPAGSYALTDLETINTTNGNMMLHLPLVSLPAGRGGNPGAKVQLNYNSKQYDTHVEVNTGSQGEPVEQNFIDPSEEGGWKYGLRHRLILYNRNDQYPGGPLQCKPGVPGQDPDLRGMFIWKVKMALPDGSLHEFRPLGYMNNDSGYFNVRPDGLTHNCTSTSWFTGTLTYYSTDGSFLRLNVEHDSDEYWGNNPWTLYYPDGGRVTFNEPGAGGQRIYDRNSNYIEIQGATYNDHPADIVVDQLGRQLIIEYDYAARQDYVYEWGFNNQEIKWTVKWTDVWVFKNYYLTRSGEYPFNLGTFFPAVERITLPSQAGSLTYTFGYNPGAGNPSYGWGEISSLTLPSGAQATYQYSGDGQNSIFYNRVLEHHPTRKDLVYQGEYDGSSTTITETWHYGTSSAQGGVTVPNGESITDYYVSNDLNLWDSGLSYKTERSDSKVERIWQENRPHGVPTQNAAFNPYVKTEFTSLKDASGNYSRTSIKDFTYDKTAMSHRSRNMIGYLTAAFRAMPAANRQASQAA